MLEGHIVQIGVAIGRLRGLKRCPARIGLLKQQLKFAAWHAALAAHAAHHIEPAMQIDHRLAASGLMQAVHVLGEQHFQLAARFQRSERVMGGIGLCLAEARPADQAARPVALPRG